MPTRRQARDAPGAGRIGILLIAAAGLGGCRDRAPPPPPPTVRTSPAPEAESLPAQRDTATGDSLMARDTIR